MSGTSEWTHQPTARGGRSDMRRRIEEQSDLLGRLSLFQDLPKRQLRRSRRRAALAGSPRGTSS